MRSYGISRRPSAVPSRYRRSRPLNAAKRPFPAQCRGGAAGPAGPGEARGAAAPAEGNAWPGAGRPPGTAARATKACTSSLREVPCPGAPSRCAPGPGACQATFRGYGSRGYPAAVPGRSSCSPLYGGSGRRKSAGRDRFAISIDRRGHIPDGSPGGLAPPGHVPEGAPGGLAPRSAAAGSAVKASTGQPRCWASRRSARSGLTACGRPTASSMGRSVTESL